MLSDRCLLNNRLSGRVVSFITAGCTLLMILQAVFVFSQESMQATANVDSLMSTWQPFRARETYFYLGENQQARMTVDTSLHNFQVYDPALIRDFRYRTIGSLGLPAFPVFYQPDMPFGFSLGYSAFDIYKLSRNNVRKYITSFPFTEFNMMIGRRREQLVSVYHAQTIRNRFYFGFEYNRSAGKGFFRRQQCNNNNFAVNLSYQSRNQRYSISPLFLFNNINAQENGGLNSANILYKDTTLISQELIGVRLSDARTEMRDRELFISQTLSLGKTIVRKINDTISVDQLVPAVSLYYQTGYLRNKIRYADFFPDSNYYGFFFPNRDALLARDSIGHFLFGQGVTNKVGVRLQFANTDNIDSIVFRNMLFDAHVEQLYYWLTYADKEQKVHNLNVSIQLRNHPESLSRWSYVAKAAFSAVDYNAGDLLVEGRLGYWLSKKAGKIETMATWQRNEPAWFYQRFAAGNVTWTADFSKIQLFSLGMHYSLPSRQTSVSADFHNLNRWVYVDSLRLPHQHGDNLQAWIFSLAKNFRLKDWGLDNLIRIQHFTGKLIRMPTLWLRHSIFYEHKIFRGALQPRIGIDMIYNTPYHANGYFPLTGQFYLQDQQLLRFYPVFDVFAAFKVKTFRLFLKIDHINQGWMKKQPNYYNFYLYPGMQRTFRIGINWRFYD